MISIVIPVWQNHEMTHECIYAIQECTQDFELVIIDNGSAPPYTPPLVTNGLVQLITNEENLGFPKAANQGIEAANGDVIVLFNNDIIVTPGWAETLLSYLEADDFDIVAPMTLFSAGIQMATINNYNTKEQLYDAAAEYCQGNKGMATEVRYAIVSMFIKKAVFDKIGLLDDFLSPCSGEDLDMCFRAREAGFRIGVVHDAYVHHEGSVTFKAMEEAGKVDYDAVVAQNDKRLAEKWGDDFWDNQIVYDEKQVGVKEGLRLNLGSGGYNMEGFINIDQFERVNPDIVANVCDLPYEENSVDEIYCGHLLEHLTWNEGQTALMHWIHMLKPGGEISIVVPDFDKLVKIFQANPTASELIHLNDRYIYSYIQDSLHRYMYNATLLKHAMATVGFIVLEEMSESHEYYVENVNWQVGIRGEKP